MRFSRLPASRCMEILKTAQARVPVLLTFLPRRFGFAARGFFRCRSQGDTMASASISTSISGETNPLTCTIAVAGRILPKNSPWARPIFSHSAMFVTYIRVRTTSSSARAGLVQRGFDVAQRLQRLRVGVTHADDFTVRTGGRRAGNVHRIAYAHRSRIADNRLPGSSGRNIRSFHGRLFSPIFCHEPACVEKLDNRSRIHLSWTRAEGRL